MNEDTFIVVDPEALSAFLDESAESLDNVSSLLVTLEDHPQDTDLINSVMRPVHSLKGSAPFFGLTGVKTLAHEMESIFVMVRDRKLGVSGVLVDLMLQGVDELKAMLARSREGKQEIADQAKISGLIKAIKELPQQVRVSTEQMWSEAFIKLNTLKDSAVLSDELRRSVAEVMEILGELNPAATKQETKSTTEARPAVPEPLMELKQILDKPLVTALAPEIGETVLTNLEKLRSLIQAADKAALLDKAIENYHTIVPALGFDPVLRDLIWEGLEPLSDPTLWAVGEESTVSAGREAANTGAAAKTGSTAGGQGADAQKTIRIQEERIDTFLSFVGELIIVGEMFECIMGRLAKHSDDRELLSEFRRANEIFAGLSDKLQQAVMSIRHVPIRPLLQKTSRIIRDVAKERQKQIKVEVSGEDIEVDKSLLELLDAPLVHLARNAADHGIETPQARAAAGKEPTGTIFVQVAETERHIVLTVRDDGGGLNYEAIRKKGESLGVVRPGEQLTTQRITDLIFMAGLSTSKEVTNISGRGVGMDVVKQMLEASGGSISVESEAGKGTCFEVRAPRRVTTQIMDGLLVAVKNDHYYLPLQHIQDVFKEEERQHSHAGVNAEYVVRHGQILPIVRLGEVLGVEHSANNAEQEHLVTVHLNGEEVAFAVDNVLGINRFVLKSIDWLERGQADFLGAASW